MFSTYIVSIFWRVSVAEQKLFGRSYLIPMAMQLRQYTDEPVPESFGSMTYRFRRQGKEVVVYKQMINGFQHTYGSALTAFELGEAPSDMLFRMNEYAEAFVAFLTRDSRLHYRYLDTKKDLSNNAVGRRIGDEARSRGLCGRDARNFMLQRILNEVEDGNVISHYLDPRVADLPSPQQYGCPGLPGIPAR